MSTTNQDNAPDKDVSDIKAAADNANVTEIQNNLQQTKPVDTAEALTTEQKPPFINDTLRTDKP